MYRAKKISLFSYHRNYYLRSSDHEFLFYFYFGFRIDNTNNVTMNWNVFCQEVWQTNTHTNVIHAQNTIEI